MKSLAGTFLTLTFMYPLLSHRTKKPKIKLVISTTITMAKSEMKNSEMPKLMFNVKITESVKTTSKAYDNEF